MGNCTPQINQTFDLFGMVSAMEPEPTVRPRPQRSDGEQSRERLLHAAVALFAQHGFAKTSTREIAEAAGTNLAAISYYFGDKAGLYRAAYTEPMGQGEIGKVREGDAGPSMPEALRHFYASFIGPLRQGAMVRSCMKLQMREMLEPTGLWQHEVAHNIKPMHDALVQLLRRHLGLRRVDDDLQRLALCISALGVHLHIASDVIDVLAPTVLGSDKSFDTWLDRLVMYAQAMIDAEAARRRAAAPTPRNSKR